MGVWRAAKHCGTRHRAILSGDYTPGAEAAYQHKDLGFVLEAARERGVATPVTAVVDQFYGAMRVTGRERLDHSAVVEIIELLSRGSPAPGDPRSPTT